MSNAATHVARPPGGPRPADRPAADVRAETVAKSYAMGTARLEVLRGCDLTVAAGEFVAIMGKSGSGKSTLLHILGGLDVPQGGQVYFRGQPVFAPPGQRRLAAGLSDVFSPAERARNHLRRTQFGFVFQFYHLLPELSVVENVMLPRMVATSLFAWPRHRAAARNDAVSILRRVGLAERLHHRPAQLSGGERQRAAIARAIVHRPALLLADEPTGNLDAEAGGRILALLGELHREGQTIVMVTHDPSIAKAADRVLVLENGRLKPSG